MTCSRDEADVPAWRQVQGYGFLAATFRALIGRLA